MVDNLIIEIIGGAITAYGGRKAIKVAKKYPHATKERLKGLIIPLLVILAGLLIIAYAQINTFTAHD